MGRADSGRYESLSRRLIVTLHEGGVPIGNQPGPRAGAGSPFPVSPSGGKPGREGSPHAGATLRASQKRWHASCAGSPHKRAAAPLCIPRLAPRRIGPGREGREDRFNTSTKGTTGAVYTKYLTLPSGSSLVAKSLCLKSAFRVPFKVMGSRFLPRYTPLTAEPSKNSCEGPRPICLADANLTLPENANEAALVQRVTT
jgi:hypothetical protein